MASASLRQGVRVRYAKLLCLYPKPYRECFREGMEQTFYDLCRERLRAKGGWLRLALWVFIETGAGIIRENLTLHLLESGTLFRAARLTALILLIPLFGNLFVHGWNWPVGALLFLSARSIAGARARGQPRGMARALFAMALAQASVPVIALPIWSPAHTPWAPGVLPVFGLNTVFVALFGASAFLFQRASITRF